MVISMTCSGPVLASAYDLRRVEEESLAAFDADTARWGLTEAGEQALETDGGDVTR